MCPKLCCRLRTARAYFYSVTLCPGTERQIKSDAQGPVVTKYSKDASAHGTTVTPMLLQLPMTLRATLSSELVPFKWSSVALSLAISYTCLTLSEPALTPAGPAAPAPVSIPAACLIRYDVGGVLVTQVNVRSGWIVMMTGVGVPGRRCAVRAAKATSSGVST